MGGIFGAMMKGNSGLLSTIGVCGSAFLSEFIFSGTFDAGEHVTEEHIEPWHEDDDWNW